MSLRDEKQLYYAKAWLASPRKNILNLCPRFGKIRTAIHILRKGYTADANVLIAIPEKEIKKSWIVDFYELGYENPNVVFTTHHSIKKHVFDKFDLVIIDEIHLLSENQMLACKSLFKINKHVLGLTGTLSIDTRIALLSNLDMEVYCEYSITEGIEDGIISDYEIRVLFTPLDPHEKSKFDKLTDTIKKIMRYRNDPKMFLLSRMRVIQHSVAKIKLTRKLIKESKKERTLTFCGLIDVAESLGVPCAHSKAEEKDLLSKFSVGEGNHLAVVKLGNTGITYKPLSKVIINYFSSNPEDMVQKIMRCMSYEYDNEEKKAIIYVVCSDEQVEKKWLVSALAMFDSKKVKFIN